MHNDRLDAIVYRQEYYRFQPYFRSTKKRHQRYDLSSYSNDISYNILTWDEVLANRLSGFILS